MRQVHQMAQDGRYAVRQLGKAPGFTVVATLTLAVGIAASTTIFSIVNALLLRPLAVEEPGALFRLSWVTPERQYRTHSYPEYRELAAAQDVFTGLAVEGWRDFVLGGEESPEIVFSGAVSANYWTVLGLQPFAGRFFGPDDDGDPVVVISHRLWEQRFLRNPDAIGQEVRLNGQVMSVSGVLPPDFGGTMVGTIVDVWLPLGSLRLVDPDFDPEHAGSYWLESVARLPQGVTPALAEERLAALDLGTPRPQAQAAEDGAYRLHRLTGLPPQVRGMVIGFTGMLLATALLVLFIGSVNLAGMLLARATARRREVAIRLAIGATRGRVVRQLVTESVLLASLGGAAGLLLAFWTVELLWLLVPPIPEAAALHLDLALDRRVLAFATLVSLGTGILFGLAPALQATRSDVTPALKQGSDAGAPGAGGKRGGARPSRVRNVLVASQIAMSLLLLIVAALLGRALQEALAVDIGFDPDGVLVSQVRLGSHDYDAERGRAFYDDLIRRATALPGAVDVGLAMTAPLGTSINTIGFEVDGERVPGGVRYNIVDPGFFQALRIPLRAGRIFTEVDRQGAPAVVAINETMARTYWPDGDAIGQTVRFTTEHEIVGVVADGKYSSYTEDPVPYVYFPAGQWYSARMNVFIRSATEPSTLLPPLQAELRALDPDVPLEYAMPLSTLVGTSLFPQRFAAGLIGTFGLIGLFLALIGIYGVISFATAMRTREMGIRLALGATARAVMALVFRQGLRIVLVGVAVGLAAAAALTHLLGGLLHGLRALDPVAFTAASLLLLAAACVALYLPARRASRVDPMDALRSE